MEWQRRFYEWFLAQLLATLERHKLQRVEEGTTVAPRPNGQHVRDAQGRVQFTRRQSNLAARPGQPVVGLPGQQLGDGGRARIPFEPQPEGLALPPRRYPWAVPDPVAVPALKTRGVADPTLFTPVAPAPALGFDPSDAWFKLLGDPHDLMEYAYGDTIGNEWLALTLDAGPSWCFPFAAEATPAYGVYAFEIPTFTSNLSPYLNVPADEVGGAARTLFDGTVHSLPYQLVREAIRAEEDRGEHYRTFGVAGNAGSAQVALFTYRDLLSVAPSAQWPWTGALVPWTVRRYNASGSSDPFQSSVWEFTTTNEGGADAIAVEAAIYDADAETWSVPSDYGAVHLLRSDEQTGLHTEGLRSDGRDPHLHGQFDINQRITPGGDGTDRYHYRGEIGATSAYLAIDSRVRFDHRTNEAIIRTSVRHVHYADTTWEVILTPGDGSPQAVVHSGVGYTIGGAYLDSAATGDSVEDTSTSVLTDPEWVRPYRAALKLTVPFPLGLPDFTNDQMALYFACAGGDMVDRIVTRNYDDASLTNTEVAWWHEEHAGSPLPSRPAYAMGVDAEWMSDEGGAAVEFGYTRTLAGVPSIPTVGRFSMTDFGPASVATGLRMSHQETFSDLEDEDGNAYSLTIGRVLSLVPVEQVRVLFPPVALGPEATTPPFDQDAAADASIYQAFARDAGVMLDGVEGEIPRPFASATATFQGITIDPTAAFSVDALDHEDGILALHVASDYATTITRAGEVAWTGALADLLSANARNLITDAGDPAPVQHQRFLHPSWPTRVLAVHLGTLQLVFRARTGDDVVGPRGAPLAFSHFVPDYA